MGKAWDGSQFVYIQWEGAPVDNVVEKCPLLPLTKPSLLCCEKKVEGEPRLTKTRLNRGETRGGKKLLKVKRDRDMLTLPLKIAISQIADLPFTEYALSLSSFFPSFFTPPFYEQYIQVGFPLCRKRRGEFRTCFCFALL